MARPPSRLAHIISLRARGVGSVADGPHQRPAGQPRALQPDRVADRRARRHDQRRHRLRQRVDPGVGGQLGRQPVGQRRVHQRVLGAQERAGDARLDVGLLVGDDRAARYLRPGPGRGRDAHQRHRRGLVGDAARGEPQVGAALPDHQPRRLGGVHRRSAAQRHHRVAARCRQRLGGLLDHRHRRLARVLLEPHGAVQRRDRRGHAGHELVEPPVHDQERALGALLLQHGTELGGDAVAEPDLDRQVVAKRGDHRGPFESGSTVSPTATVPGCATSA